MATDNKSVQTTHTETATVHVETKKGHPKPNIHVIVNSEDAFERQVNGFFGFLREKAIVGLAVGFVVATQVQGLVKQLISSFLDPLVLLLFGKTLSSRTFTWHLRGRHANFAWGQFIYALLDFLVVVIALYALIKLFKLDKLDAPAKAEPKKN